MLPGGGRLKNWCYFRQRKITSCQLCLFVGTHDLCFPICRGVERNGSCGLCLDNPWGNSDYIRQGEIILVDERGWEMAGRHEISSRSWNEVQAFDFLKGLSVGCENEAIKITTKIVQVCRHEQSFAVIYWPSAEKKMFLPKGSLPVKQYRKKMQNCSYKHERGICQPPTHTPALRFP